MDDFKNPMPLPELAPNSLAAFEKYYAREPLNPELADILAGKSDGEAQPAADETTKESTTESTVEGTRREAGRGLLDWTPSRKDVGELAETVSSPGWEIAMLLMKKRLESLRETAISVSQNDPLRNKDAVADEWAYHGQYRRVLGEIGPMMQDQIKRLKVAE